MSGGAAVLFLLAFFAWIFLACGLGIAGLRAGSLRVEAQGPEVAFRPRAVGRVGGTMLALWLGIGSLWQCSLAVTASGGGLGVLLLCLPVIAAGGGLGGLLLYLAGPRDLCLDPDRRAYRFVYGWPLCPQVVAGGWADMAGVYVRAVRRQGSSTYYVEIAWRMKRSGCPLLGLFSGEREADAQACEVAALLGVPRIAPPPRGRAWVAPGEESALLSVPAPPRRPFRPDLSSLPAIRPASDADPPAA